MVLDDIVSRLEQVQVFDKYVSALCVFHSDSKPSMLVFKDGWFRCLGCGRNGRWVTLWNKLQGQPVNVMPERRTSWDTPVKRQEDLEEVCYQAHADVMQFSSFKWYMEMRGLQDRIEVNEIGYVRGWYSFPVRNREGAFQTAVFRAAPHVQVVTGLRYWCASTPTMYVPDWHKVRSSGRIFVVFGILDALTLADLRLPVVTSTAGNLTFNSAWLDEYRGRIYIIPDKGEHNAAMSLANKLGWRGKIINLDYPVGIKDPNGYFENGKRELLEKSIQQEAQ